MQPKSRKRKLAEWSALPERRRAALRRAWHRPDRGHFERPSHDWLVRRGVKPDHDTMRSVAAELKGTNPRYGSSILIADQWRRARMYRLPSGTPAERLAAIRVNYMREISRIYKGKLELHPNLQPDEAAIYPVPDGTAVIADRAFMQLNKALPGNSILALAFIDRDDVSGVEVYHAAVCAQSGESRLLIRWIAAWRGLSDGTLHSIRVAEGAKTAMRQGIRAYHRQVAFRIIGE